DTKGEELESASATGEGRGGSGAACARSWQGGRWLDSSFPFPQLRIRRTRMPCVSNDRREELGARGASSITEAEAEAASAGPRIRGSESARLASNCSRRGNRGALPSRGSDLDLQESLLAAKTTSTRSSTLIIRSSAVPQSLALHTSAAHGHGTFFNHAAWRPFAAQRVMGQGAGAENGGVADGGVEDDDVQQEPPVPAARAGTYIINHRITETPKGMGWMLVAGVMSLCFVLDSVAMR
ncbi:hypothetical protein TSOC_009256, partial [Tetrabaena socialis]